MNDVYHNSLHKPLLLISALKMIYGHPQNRCMQPECSMQVPIGNVMGLQTCMGWDHRQVQVWVWVGDVGVIGVTCQLWTHHLSTTFTHHHQSFAKHTKCKNDKSKIHYGTWGGGDRNIVPCQCTSPHRPTPPFESHMVAHHHKTPLKHWGACSAPQLPFPWLSDPHKVAWQCQLTLALPLWGLLVTGGIPLHRLEYLWVFINPLPIPMKTYACRHGYRFWWVQVQVLLENPRVAFDIP